MDLLRLGTAAKRVHDRSLQASSLQKWAATASMSSLHHAFDSDDALISLRRTPAVTETAASLASKVSDATAARLAHTLDRLSPDTAPVPRRQEEDVATTPRPQGKEVAEDLYARLGGTSPFRGSPETFKPSPPRVSVARSPKPTPPPRWPRRLRSPPPPPSPAGCCPSRRGGRPKPRRARAPPPPEVCPSCRGE